MTADCAVAAMPCGNGPLRCKAGRSWASGLSASLAAGNLEGVLGSLDKEKYPVPEPFPFEEARRLFKGAHSGQAPPR